MDYQLEDIVVVISTVTLFFYLNGLIRRKSASFGSAEGDWIWANTTVSLVHAIISGTWALTCLYWSSSEDTFSDNYSARWLCRFTIAYSIYDFIDYYLQPNRKNDLSTVGILVHHIISVSNFALGLHLGFNNFIARGLTVEVNSIFLHCRRLLKLTKSNPQSLVYRINNAIFFCTCLIFRFGLASFLWYVLYFRSSGHMHPALATYLGVSIFFFAVLSIYMVMRIYQNDCQPRARRKEVHINGFAHGANSVSSSN